MSFGLLLDRHARLRSLAMTLACLLFGSASQALAADATFELSQVLEMLKREIAASESPADAGRSPVRIEEAQVDLDLVEVTGKSGARLLVPGSDFAVGKEDAAAKPALRRRIVVDFTPAKEARATEPAAVGVMGNITDTSAMGGLSRAIAELRAAVRTGVEAQPQYELKR